MTSARQALPTGWQRRGPSLGEQMADMYPPDATVIVDPTDYTDTFSTGSMFQAAIQEKAFLVTKLSMGSAAHSAVARQAEEGGLFYKVDLVRYPPYPLVYQRLFVPIEPVFEGDTLGVSGLMAENVADCTHPDLQDWALSLREGGSVAVTVCDQNGAIVAQGNLGISAELGFILFSTMDEAQRILRQIDDAASFNDAGQQFFRDYPEPTWHMTIESKKWWQFWR